MYSILFTAVPDKQKTDALNGHVKEIICKRLASIIRQVGEQLNIKFNSELDQLEKFHAGIINPALFYYYFELKEAIANGKVNEILATIKLIFNLPVILNRKNKSFPNIVSAINSEWEQNLFNKSIRKDSISDFGMKHNFEIVNPIFENELQQQIKYVKSALEILERIDAVHSYSATHQLNEIKIFDGTVRGFSYQAAYGNIYIRSAQQSDNTIAYYLEHIVHECAHQHLFALQLIDPIIINNKNELFDAPIRMQKRPMDGIFHACFVLARMVRCFQRTKSEFEHDINQTFLEKIDAWFNKSYETVKEHAKLTDKGRQLFNTLKICAYE